jgi:hypothetical protein
VRLGIASNEVWKAWCALQTKIYLQLDGGYECCLGSVANQNVCDPANPNAGDYGKARTCDLTCACTALACSVPSSPPNIRFDVQVQNDQLTGAVSGLLSTPFYNVYLTRSH